MDIKNIKSPLQFTGLRVSNFNFSTKEFNDKNSQVEVNYKIDFDTNDYKENNGNLSAKFIFIVKIEAYSNGESVFNLFFDIESKYYCSDISFDKELFLNSIQFNGIINCGQFSRNYLRSVLLLAGVNPIIDLPLLDPNKMLQEKLNQKSKPYNT